MVNDDIRHAYALAFDTFVPARVSWFLVKAFVFLCLRKSSAFWLQNESSEKKKITMFSPAWCLMGFCISTTSLEQVLQMNMLPLTI
jgi:hypothetical protein